MGKIRAKTLGDQEAEQKEKEAAEARRVAKIEAAKAEGQEKKAAEVAQKTQLEVSQPAAEEKEEKKNKKISKYAAKKGKKRERSENYQKAAQMIDKSKLYSVKEALELLEKTHLAKFDETVELHINTISSGLSGQVTLPHGTGKTVRVAILAPTKDAKAADDLLKEIEAGKISFDILVATPDAMPRLARVAKVLGPKGLMPNPKNGTISVNPDAVAKQYAGGQMYYKTEAKTPIIHAAVGKLSFGVEKLSQNITAFLHAVKMENIKTAVAKSTMSPAIKLQLEK